MTGRIEKVLLIVLSVTICVLLLVMFFLNTTAAVKTAKIYNISILVRSPSERFVKGVDQAALDYNADVHFVSGYSRGDGVQQIEYLRRELENNADAVVLWAENSAEMEEYLDSIYPHPVVVTVGQRLKSSRPVHVGADDAKLGESLGGLILAERTGKECLILCPTSAKPYHEQRRDGLKKVLEENEVPYTVLYCSDEDVGYMLAGRDSAVIAVLDESLLVPACEKARQDDLLFGTGFTGGARPYLEVGRIRGLVVYSEYDAGYLSLQEAVFMADKKPGSPVELDSHIANSDTMREPPLVYILFPIG